MFVHFFHHFGVLFQALNPFREFLSERGKDEVGVQRWKMGSLGGLVRVIAENWGSVFVFSFHFPVFFVSPFFFASTLIDLGAFEERIFVPVDGMTKMRKWNL